MKQKIKHFARKQSGILARNNKKDEHIEISFLGFSLKSINPSNRSLIIIAMAMGFLLLLSIF